MNVPAWLLLFWCGLAATCVAALAGSVVGGVPVARWSLAAAPRSRLHGATATLLAGALLYPLAYGLIFELLHRADYKLGLLLGLIHGMMAFLLARRGTATRNSFRVAIAHAAYGLVLGFLYVTP